MNKKFNPLVDGKPYASKDPITTVARIIAASVRLLRSEYPQDYWIWLKSLVLRGKMLSFPLPWLNFPAIHAIHQYLEINTQTSVLEFGAGNSTLYWAQYGAHVDAIEGDPKWLTYIQQKIVENGLQNINLLHANNDIQWMGAIEHFGSQQYNLILVDGGPRPACVRVAIPHVRPGGLLVIDNTDWHWWNKPIQLVPQAWEQISFRGHVPMSLNQNETTICIRPYS